MLLHITTAIGIATGVDVGVFMLRRAKVNKA